MVREAICACGDMKLTLEGEPVLVSSCCCTRCQRRTGALFGVTVYFERSQMVARVGAENTFRRSDAAATFHFCPRCGSNLWWSFEGEDENVVGVAGGAFADPTLPSPERMVFTAHKHPYVLPPPGVPIYEHGPDE